MESFFLTYGLLFWGTMAVLFLVGPFLAIWLIYRLTHDLRRIASALERMEERQVAQLPSGPTVGTFGEALDAARARRSEPVEEPHISTSMFGR